MVALLTSKALVMEAFSWLIRLHLHVLTDPENRDGFIGSSVPIIVIDE
jgi:hypothetical protein